MAVQPKPKLRIVDDGDVREHYCNKLVSSNFDGAAVTLTLGTTRYTPEQTDDLPKAGAQPDIFVTNRIALAPAAAIELLNALNMILNAMSKSGAGGITAGQPPATAAKPEQPPAARTGQAPAKN